MALFRRSCGGGSWATGTYPCLPHLLAASPVLHLQALTLFNHFFQVRGRTGRYCRTDACTQLDAVLQAWLHRMCRWTQNRHCKAWLAASQLDSGSFHAISCRSPSRGGQPPRQAAQTGNALAMDMCVCALALELRLHSQAGALGRPAPPCLASVIDGRLCSQ